MCALTVGVIALIRLHSPFLTTGCKVLLDASRSIWTLMMPCWGRRCCVHAAASICRFGKANGPSIISMMFVGCLDHYVCTWQVVRGHGGLVGCVSQLDVVAVLKLHFCCAYGWL